MSDDPKTASWLEPQDLRRKKIVDAAWSIAWGERSEPSRELRLLFEDGSSVTLLANCGDVRIAAGAGPSVPVDGAVPPSTSVWYKP